MLFFTNSPVPNGERLLVTTPPTESPPRSRPTLRLAGAPWAAAVTGLAGVVASGAAGLAAGPDQGRSVLLGTALVCGFFLFGALNTGLAAAFAPNLSLVVALLTYTVQIVVLGLVLVWVRRSDPAPAGLDLAWVGGTVVAGTLLWTVALVLRALRDPGVGR